MTYTGQIKRPDWTWILVVMALAAIISSFSCSPSFYCKHCPTSVKDSIYVHDTTIVRDTIIKIDERSVTIHDTVPCDDFTLNKDSNGVKIIIKVKDRVIYANATCAALELKLKLYNKVRKIYRSRELIRYIPQDKPKTFWQWLTFWESWACLVLIGGLIALKILKFYKKISIPFI